ncbi:MAG: hypothetical protein DRN17_06485 [Thermoplasmata archaeon]|nr:MAG: hypothetical protein DRN17_06485 [Thermoplasmata archaeon]
MQARDIDGALLAYERVTCEMNLANLIISLCLHIEGEQYTDGEVMDLVLEICDVVRASDHYKVRRILENWEVIEWEVSDG